MTKGESLTDSHLIIMCRARSIITITISTIRGLHRRIRQGRRSKATKTGLSASDTTNSSVLLTHLIRKMVKPITKINTHKLKLVHDGSEKCLYSRRRWWRRHKIGSRGIGSTLSSSYVSLLLLGGSRLLARPFGLGRQLCSTPLHRFLTNSTHEREEMWRRNRNVHVCENSWREG